MFGKFFIKLDRVLTQIEEWTLFAIVMAALISLFVNVVLRYGFNQTLAWSEELGRIVMIYTTFVGTSLSIKRGAVIRIDALVQIVPRLKPLLTVCTNVLMLSFAWVMIYYGCKMTLQQYTTRQATIIMQIPLVIVYAVMPVTGMMVFIRTVQLLIQNMKQES